MQPSKTIRIGIAEHQTVFRNGLVSILKEMPNVIVLHEMNNGEELIQGINNYIPDILVLNHHMPGIDGIKSSQMAREKFPLVKIIILSQEINDKEILAAIENGASVYLSKDDSLNEIKKAIQGLLDNVYFINDRVSKILINNLMAKGNVGQNLDNKIEDFSSNEIQIIRLISQEFTTKQIADCIFRSSRTVEKYRSKMFLKVNVQSSVGLVVYAIKNNLIEI